MIDILTSSAEVLGEAGFTTGQISINDHGVLVFEDTSVLGFLFVYDDPAQLVGSWEEDAKKVITEHQLGLRRAAQKAWNTYIVLLTGEGSGESHLAALAAIEEDLTGTRKIARVGIRDSVDLREALLSLLPLQAAPRLEAVDMQAEIRQRATELQPRAIDAFLSTSDDAVILQVLEEEP